MTPAPVTPAPPPPSASPVPVRDDSVDADDTFVRARSGERVALEALIEREWPRLHRIVVAEINDRGDAEDLTQEAFARVLPRLASFADAGAFRAYLSQAGRNLVRDRWRRRRHLEASAEVGDYPSEVEGPETLALSELDHATLYRALAELPEDYATVLRLRLALGLTGAETATRMGRTDVAVRQLQHRALLALRETYLTLDVGAGGE